uniref:Uncharacterized protein n=1 Tax=Lepeophtheirus salmonis TaxID=72036 RepID=A0A0K2V7H5_LEPSM
MKSLHSHDNYAQFNQYIFIMGISLIQYNLCRYKLI